MADYEAISAAWLEPANPDFSEPKNHPNDMVLRSFLDRTLPVKLRASTVNMQQIVEGTVEEWFSPDVRAHLSICSVCTRRLTALRQTMTNDSKVKVIFKDSGSGGRIKEIFRLLFFGWIVAFYHLISKIVIAIVIAVKQKFLRRK